MLNCISNPRACRNSRIVASAFSCGVFVESLIVFAIFAVYEK